VIPYDFFFDGNYIKQGKINKQFEPKLLQRFGALGGAKLFYKGVGEPQMPDLAPGRDALLDFGERIDVFRSIILKMITPRLKAFVAHNCPKLVVGYDDCKTFDDYLSAIKIRPYGKKARAMWWMVCHTVWGKTCSHMIEKDIMDILWLEYSEQLVTGEKTKQRRNGGSIRLLTSRKRQLCIVDPFRFVFFVTSPCSVGDTHQLNSPIALTPIVISKKRHQNASPREHLLSRFEHHSKL